MYDLNTMAASLSDSKSLLLLRTDFRELGYFTQWQEVDNLVIDQLDAFQKLSRHSIDDLEALVIERVSSRTPKPKNSAYLRMLLPASLRSSAIV